MQGFEYLLGDAINEFPRNRLPTLGEVLRFYSQYWGMKGSESLREKLVADELLRVYKSENSELAMLSEKAIKNKINKNVCTLKSILKFRSKQRTSANIKTEANFRNNLDETFELYQSTNKRFRHATELDDIIEIMDYNSDGMHL